MESNHFPRFKRPLPITNLLQGDKNIIPVSANTPWGINVYIFLVYIAFYCFKYSIAFLRILMSSFAQPKRLLQELQMRPLTLPEE